MICPDKAQVWTSYTILTYKVHRKNKRALSIGIDNGDNCSTNYNYSARGINLDAKFFNNAVDEVEFHLFHRDALAKNVDDLLA